MSSIRILSLKGNKKMMGEEYGRSLKNELGICLNLLKEFYINKHNLFYDQLIKCADEFYNRYPLEYQEFIKAIAIGSDLSLDEVKILNAMEVIRSLVDLSKKLGACSFINIPGAKTVTGANLIGRNYDYSGEIYKEISKYLVLVVLKEDNKVPTAFIALPGQIYAITAINSNSLFLEFNNAMPSGGFAVNEAEQTLLINLLIAIQNSRDFSELDQRLCKLDSDFSLVINAADKTNLRSYEYSSFKGKKTYQPEKHSSFASTNFYLNKEWNLGVLEDSNTWEGVTRMNNLLRQTMELNYSVNDMMNILDIKLADGGAKLDYTIYQIIFDSKSQDLYIKRTHEDKNWTHVELNKLFR
jgi:hypothetical protein